MELSFVSPSLTLAPRSGAGEEHAMLYPPGAYIDPLEAQATLAPAPMPQDLLRRVDDDAQLATFTESDLADAYSRAHADCATSTTRKERIRQAIVGRGLSAVQGQYQRWKVSDVQGAKRVNVERMVRDGLITEAQKHDYTEIGKGSKRLSLDAAYLPGHAG